MSKKKTVYSPLVERHRWALRFDSAVGLDSFCVQRISPLTYDAKTKSWKDVHIEFLEVLNSSSFMKMVDMAKDKRKQKPIVLEFLDGPGKVGHKMVFMDYEIQNVDHDELNYGNGDIATSRMTISPIAVEFCGT